MCLCCDVALCKTVFQQIPQEEKLINRYTEVQYYFDVSLITTVKVIINCIYVTKYNYTAFIFGSISLKACQGSVTFKSPLCQEAG